jgi:hypothetical protein
MEDQKSILPTLADSAFDSRYQIILEDPKAMTHLAHQNNSSFRYEVKLNTYENDRVSIFLMTDKE